MLTIDSQRRGINLGFLILLLFAISRPITLTFTRFSIEGLSAFELFGICISYLILIAVLIGLRQLPLDRTTLLSLVFCYYCVVSMFWGSNISMVARATLPFLIYLAARIYIVDLKKANAILIALTISYLIPITMNMYDLALGKSFSEADYFTGISRFGGSYKGSHVLAYSMLVFSFLYCLMHRIVTINGRFRRIGIFLILLFSLLCIYKSFTRTVLFGSMVYWLIYLWGNNRKYFFVTILACGLIGIAASQQVEKIVWKTQEHDINMASSGRLTLWGHNIKVFADSNPLQQLFGRGLGVETKTADDTEFNDWVWPSHNDYLSLLMTTGVIGLLLYLFLLVSLMWDIFSCELDLKTKYLFGAIVISAAFMNFVSNAVIFRVELSQYFWLFMGYFYFLSEKSNSVQPS